MRRGAQGRFGLAGVLALALGLLPGAAPGEAAAPILALLAAQCADPAAAPPMPEGWAPVPEGMDESLINGIAAFEARIEQVLDRPLSNEPELGQFLARRMAAWLAETHAGRMRAGLWQHDGTPELTLLRAAGAGGAAAALHIVHCRLLIEDPPPALTEALIRRFEILPESQGMQARIWAGGAEIATPAGRETHSRELLILPAWTPYAVPGAMLGYGVIRMGQ